MANVISQHVSGESSRNPERQAYQLLHLGFIAAPAIAGLDKFTQLLTNWDAYLAPVLARPLGGAAHGFMMVVGAVEIAAGLLVAVRPRIGAYVVAAWLVGIIGNLLLSGRHFDIALRDFGLLLGALALARLAQVDYRAAPRRPRS
ncbi:DoxX family membrane protein [soil metagenome]